jgi:hypothetical protein
MQATFAGDGARPEASSAPTRPREGTTVGRRGRSEGRSEGQVRATATAGADGHWEGAGEQRQEEGKGALPVLLLHLHPAASSQHPPARSRRASTQHKPVWDRHRHPERHLICARLHRTGMLHGRAPDGHQPAACPLFAAGSRRCTAVPRVAHHPPAGRLTLARCTSVRRSIGRARARPRSLTCKSAGQE